MKLGLGPEIIGSYKRLSYKEWYGLAEFVDNSTQAYFNNKSELDEEFKKSGDILTVRIDLPEDENGKFLRISDNSIGMSEDELSDAVTIGKPPEYTGGRSKYGLGMKTAAFWFGDSWTIETTKLNDKSIHKVEVDLGKIIDHDLDLNHSHEETESLDSHFTVIEIRNLHRGFYGNTVFKIKEYLRSIYREDIKKQTLNLYWRNELLVWDWEENIDKRLIRDSQGNKTKRIFSFSIGDKNVNGWAGVFAKGSRSDAGFSIIQSDRVIRGWPDTYRPETIFGRHEGGTNDLINQRLVGVIFLEGFDVSHTKDEILFAEDEKEILENNLLEELGDYRKLAETFRKYNSDERMASEPNFRASINEFESELNSPEILNAVHNLIIPPTELISKTNRSVKELIVKTSEPDLEVTIQDLKVYLYIVSNMSPNDPYVIFESTESKERVIVIVNKNHPYWIHLNSKDSITNFLRECTYDGVAEWKACFIAGNLGADTIKQIKDSLLRVPFEIEKNASKDSISAETDSMKKN
ncbi:MAG: ATP-binding protein [Candidatus Electryonea clarkiae]|nr:ATP-binding protein [Candidatus Electryonea clarkiae]MDP8285764.1 ATP-binding protein [Candidatus Electryonea clarkiae]